MPPHSKLLSEEGATFKSFLLVQQGQFCEREVSDALMAPAAVPGSAGTRNLKDNISDLKAQIAANQKVLALYYMSNESVNVVFRAHMQNQGLSYMRAVWKITSDCLLCWQQQL